MKRGFCAVACDIIHPGHINFIRECADQCDFLIVGVMTDKAIKEYKGSPPIMSFAERHDLVLGIRGVMVSATMHDFDGFEQIRRVYAPDVIFDSEEHKDKRKGADVYIPYTPGISSSIIKDRIIERYTDNRKRKNSRWIKRKR